ncbi:MAG: hypothetical protein ACWGSQ_08610, partial [Longimicrobiales bacterium]
MNRPPKTLFPLFLVPLAWTAMGSVFPPDTYPRQPGIDVEHYRFRVTLRDDTERITGEADVSIRFVQAGVRELALDLTSLSRGAGGNGMTVSEVLS